MDTHLESIKASWESEYGNLTNNKIPKPRIVCPECSNDLVICWGDIITKPYIRHIGEGHTINQCSIRLSGGESGIHLLSKKMLKKFLDEGGMILCNNLIFSCDGNEVQLEHRSNGCVMDMYWKNIDCKEYCIEIYHSSLTKTVDNRRHTTWVEVTAEEVLQILMQINDDTESISLTNILQSHLFVSSPTKVEKEENKNILTSNGISSFSSEGVKIGLEYGILKKLESNQIPTITKILCELSIGFIPIVMIKYVGDKNHKFKSYSKCLMCSQRSSKPLCSSCYKNHVEGKRQRNGWYGKYIKGDTTRIKTIVSWLEKEQPIEYPGGYPCFKCEKYDDDEDLDLQYHQKDFGIYESYIKYKNLYYPFCYACVVKEFGHMYL